ncbi:hypothetical protein [Pontixanthobacter sp. CEM42]|uniref:hypothetical protein n=1 Tax=Pontixanthobacter sp. CEM42 TaxID=2792077 RepID=UPI001ADFAC67|nr:hypothetical protein [Pontixanthobacter sp. CEM42]
MMRSKAEGRNTAQPHNSNRSGRLRLLGSCSAMAGAIALASMIASPAAAQSLPRNAMPVPGLDVPLPMDASGPARGPVMRGPANDISPMRSGATPFPTPIATPYYVQSKGLTLDAPSVPVPQPNSAPPASVSPSQSVVIAPTPVQTTAAQPNTNAPVVSMSTTTSSTTAPSPGDTDTNGINVRASANYFSSEVDFRPGTAVDVVELLAADAIINWTTFTAGSATTDVTFLGAGGNLEFTSALGGYTVLNRVFTPGIDSAIRIDGAVTSTVLGGTATGGNVWFYSPGGMIVGSTGSFNVGSLILTSSDMNATRFDSDLARFSGVAESDTAVVIEAGATISASDYVAVVAPRVVQGGTVSVDGSVAYVGAEEAQLTINNGLFDITVGLGTEDANGVIHTGTTTGAASQATVNGTGQIIDADARGIYMVSIAKNDAINMLVGGDIGYEAAAGAARTDNGTIILSAGANVTQSGSASAPTINIESDTAIAGGSIEFTGGTFTSDVTALASSNLDVFPEFGQDIIMGGDGRGDYALDLSAGESINFGAGIGGQIAIDGDVSLRAGLNQAIGGNATIRLAGAKPPTGPLDQIFGPGQISIGGDFVIDSSGTGRDDFFIIRDNGGTGVGEAAVGGDISVSVGQGALLDINGDLVLDASAQGGKGEVISGNATAGSISLSLGAGTLDVAGNATLNAGTLSAGDGKIGGSGPAQEGSDGFGGDVTINLSGGSFTANTLAITADGRGTTGDDSSIEQNNEGVAGSVTLDVTGGSHSFGDVTISAFSNSADSYDSAGNRYAGSAGRATADVSVSGIDSTLSITRDLRIDVSTSGIVGAPAGAAATISAQNTGTSGGLLVGDDIVVDTSAGNGSDTDVTIAGSIEMMADGSTISFDALDFDAVASPSGFAFFLFGGGRDFQAGDISITATGSGVISGRRASLSAQATGSDFSGGDGTGGNIALLADDGRIVLTQSMFATASGQGGSGFDDSDPFNVGVGQGGNLTFTVRGAGGSMDFGSVSANTDGSIFSDPEGGFGFVEGNGGNGIAGDVTFNIEGGTFDAGRVTVSSDGFGGEGGDITNLPAAPATAGTLEFFGDTVDFGGFGIQAIASVGVFSRPIVPAAAPVTSMAMVGAPGTGSGGKGGDGVGGTVTFNLTGGTMNVTDLEVTADGIGGDGAFGDFDSGTLAGDGGDAFGGTATFNAIDGTLTVTNDLTVSAQGNREFSSGDGGFGNGVAGGIGGNATGGSAIFNLNGTADITAGNVIVSADAFGGEGGTGDARFDPITFNPIAGEEGGAAGAGTGGNAVFNNDSGTISFGSLTVSADGEGGEGGGSFGISTGESANDGGIGGDGIGGTATINLNQDDGSDPVYIAHARGVGGQGGLGLDSGVGGDGSGGTARINVNNVNVNLTTATIDASATGGDGGFSDGEGGNGGDGGNATGGSAILDVNGAAGVLTSDSSITMQSNGTGGAGAEGNSPIFGGVRPGDGGMGGDGAAGLVQIIARDGGTLTYLNDSGTNVIGRGGAGGAGGNDFSGPLTADGGDAGSATGGTIEVSATTGGTVNFQPVSTSVTLNADAFGAAGGNAGISTTGFGLVGANGDANGGQITLTASGAGSAINVTSGLDASARATGFQDTRTGSIGADAEGGGLLVQVDDDSALTINGALGFSADAVGAVGFTDNGAGTGGTADIVLVGGTTTLGGIVLSLNGTGAQGGFSATGAAGTGGDGEGGTATIIVGTAATLDTSLLTANQFGIGGQGADGGNSAAEGVGGAGIGGIATISLGGTINNLAQVSVVSGATGGAGGVAGDGGDAADGGSADGGTVEFTAVGTGPVLSDISSLFLSTTATGGSGGQGGSGDFGVTGGRGGSGGDATGGSTSLAIEGTGATLTVDPTLFQIGADAAGGTGGSGGSNFSGGDGGDGGAGGDAEGGTVTVEARSGTTISLSGGSGPVQINSSGTGGAGGVGGSYLMGSGGGAGSGGDGGIGTGGSPTLRAIGGTIQGGDLQLVAAGFGGQGGDGGDDGLIIVGNSGDGGDGVGGTPLLEVLEGSPGILSFDDVDLLANGVGGFGSESGDGIGGLVTINDLSTDPAGLITLGSLDVDTTGDSSRFASGFLMTGGSGPTTVTNDMVINTAGDIVYNFDGDGQIVVGGRVQFITDANVLITHANNTVPTASFDIAGDFVTTAGGNFTSGAGSIVDAGNEMQILTGGDITADDLRSVRFIFLQARGSVALNDAIAIGPQGLSNFGGIIIDAGLDTSIPGFPQYDPNENATITGTVQSYNDIIVRSGGNATFAAGSSTTADNALSVRSGDDIIVAAGATVAAANNPTSFINLASPFANGPNLRLLAGDITNLISVPNTPIASVAIDGAVNANGGAAILTGNAVDALDGTVTASSIQADINDAPANGFALSDDNGLLDANCLQGNVCFGNVSADNRIEIGQASNNDVIALLIEQGTVNAQDILITTRADVVMGTTGIATILGAANQFAVQSTEGNVDLRDAVITSDSILISAARSLLGTSSLTSTNNIQIGVGQDVNATLIDTDGQLIDGSGSTASFTAPGSINIGTYNLGDRTARIDAGNSINIGALNIDGIRDVRLTAATTGAGDVFLGTATGAQDIILRGDNIGFTDLTSSRFINFITSGTITGGSLTSASIMTLEGSSIDVGDLDTGFITNIDATAGDVSIGNITSTSSVRIDATGNVTTLDVSAASGTQIFADGNIDVGTVVSTGATADIVLNATGTLDFAGIDGSRLVNLDGTQITGGNILAAAGVSVDGTLIDVGDVRSTGGFVGLTSTVGDVNTGDLTSDTLSVAVTSAANANVTSITAGSSGSITSTGNTIVGDITAGNNVTLDVDGNLTSGALDAQSVSPGMTITVDGDADIESADSNGLLTLTVLGDLTGGDFTGSGLTRLTAASIDITSAGSTNQSLAVTSTVGDAVIGTTTSDVSTTVTAAGAVDVVTAMSDRSVALTGTSVTLDNGTIASNLTLNATAGDVTGSGVIAVGGNVNLDATGDIGFGSLDAQGTTFTADAGGAINFTSATSGGSLAFNANGAIAGGDLTSTTALTLDGASIDVGNIDTGGTGDVTLTSTLTTIETGDVVARILTADAETDLTLGVVDAIGRTNRANAINLDANGTISFTSLLSGRAITIGNDASVDPVAVVGGTITSDNDVNITADAISLGDVTVTESGAITLESEAGNLTAGNLTSNTFGLSLTSSDAVNTGNLAVVGNANSSDIDIDAGTDVTVGDVTAGDRLTMRVGGNLIAGALVSNNNSPGMNLDITGNADIASATDADGPILISVGGALTGGQFTSDAALSLSANSIDIDGATSTNGSVGIDTFLGGAAIDTISAGNDINADIIGDLQFITATAADSVDLTATGSVLGGDITATNDVDVDANNIAIGDVNAANIGLISATDIRFNSLTSPNAITVTAANGLIGANSGNGDIDSGGDVTLDAEAIALGDIDSDGSVNADATAGNASFGTVDAANDITISASGTPSLVNAISGGNTSITGASVTFNNGTIGGDLTLNATAGDIDGNGAVTVGGAIDFDATGNVGFGDLAAQGGNFTVDANGAINFVGATSSADVVLNANGIITGGDVTATGTAQLDGGDIAVGDVSAANIDLTSGADILFDSLVSPNAITVSALNGMIGANTGPGDIDSDDDITLTAQSISVGTVAAGGSVSADATAGDASFGTVDAATDITITATGTPTVANAISGGNTSITGASVALTSGTIGGNLTLNATAGDIDGNGAVTVGGAIDFDATGNVGFGDLEAQGGDFTVDAGGDVAFGSATSSANVAITAGGTVDGTNVAAINQVDLTGSAITLTDVTTGGPINGTATGGDIIVDNMISSDDAITLDAAGNISVDHAEAATDFTATAIGNVTTGLNSIITGGNILISGDIVDLGNSSAGGSVDVTGSQIDFVTLAAGSTVDLETVAISSNNNGNGNITGVDLTAGPGASALTALGSIDVSGNTTIGGSLTADAVSNINFGTVDVQGGDFVADAGGAISYNDVTGGGDVLFAAVGAITGDDIIAAGAIQLDGGDIAVGDLDGATIALTSGADALFDTLTASGAINVMALTGAIGINAGSGDIDGGAAVDLTAQTITVGNVSATNGVTATATSGSIATGNVTTSTNGSSVALSAAGAASDISAGTVTTNGGDIAVSSGRNIALTGAATSAGTPTSGTIGLLAGGDVTVTGALSAGEDVAIRSLGNTTLGTVTAGDDVVIQADGSLTLDSATTTGTGIDLFEVVLNPANAGQPGAVAFAAETLTRSNIDLTSGADTTVTGSLDAVDDITVTATGTPSVGNAISGGDTSITGASVALNNGTIGGNLTLNATAGDIDGNGAVTVGGAIDFDATGNVGFGDLDAQGGDFTIDAGGDVAFTSATSSNNVGIQSGGALDFANINADGDVSATAQDGIVGQTIAADGSVALSGATTILQNVTAGGSVTSQSLVGAATIDSVTSGGIIDIDAAGLADIGTATATFDVNVEGGLVTIGQADAGGTVDLESGDAGSVSAGALTAGADIRVDAGSGGFTGTTLDADQAVIIFTAGGAQFTSANGDDFVSVTGDGDVAATSITGGNGAVVDVTGALTADTIAAGTNGVADITATQGITIGTLSGVAASLEADAGAVAVTTDVAVTELVRATGTNVSLTALGDLQTTVDATNGGADITTGGNLDLQGVTATGDIAVVSGGSTEVNGAPVVTTSPTPTSGTQGTQQVTSSGGNISFTVGGDLTVNAAVSAANDLTMDVNGLIDLQAVAAGQVINAQSSDITIGANGALGRSDQTDAINIATNGDIALGGAGGAQGFELDNDEFSRVHSGGDVTITANSLSTDDGNITVDDLAVAVGTGGSQTDGNIGQNGSLSLNADNNVGVVGSGVVGNAGADTTLNINAGKTLSIDPETGTLRVEDANIAITGSINLTAPSIVAASATALTDIAGGTVADIDTRLGQNDGSTRDDGVIQGSTITFTVDDALLIQNTGAGTDFADRRGLVADAVTINSNNPDVDIVINGIVGGAAGLDTIPVTGVPTDFDQASTINGCPIANPASCVVVPPDPDPTTNNPGGDPVQDLIEEQIDGTTPMDTGTIGTILVELRDDPERELDPLIDEPVTGAGNEDLWIGEEEEGEGDEDCDDPSGVCPVEGELEPAE